MTALQIMWGSLAVNVVLIIGFVIMNNHFQTRFDALRRSYRRSVEANAKRDQELALHMKNQQAKITGLVLRLEDTHRQIDVLKRVNANDAAWFKSDNDPLTILGDEDTIISGPLQ